MEVNSRWKNIFLSSDHTMHINNLIFVYSGRWCCCSSSIPLQFICLIWWLRRGLWLGFFIENLHEKLIKNLKKRWVALPLLTFNLKMIILPKLLIERIERRKLIRSLISRHSSALLFLCWVNNSTILISSSVRLTHSSQLINIHGG